MGDTEPPAAEILVVRGVVETGDQRGRVLGFPTANLGLADEAGETGEGVWAGWVLRADGQPHPAAVSVGRRPTYYGSAGLRLVEAHLLDFSGDLYGETLVVLLMRRLRSQEAFESSEALIEALTRDVENAKDWLGSHPAPHLTDDQLRIGPNRLVGVRVG
ncbi:riboflavin kinase [Amycolatopsis anabasis]|uniref:riboflavin kinase n=1 Tax=Amycolatopsis anabasis TaxID=1840409 RepID=UPI00131C9A39|nr:riboflavin kinase [Amycolatopsis anabasis]